jgi:hypothetical protein
MAMFDLSNMFKMVKQAMPDDKNVPTIETHAPAVFALNMTDNMVEEFFLVPNAMIKDIVKAVQAAMPGRTQPGDEAPGTEKPKKPHEDF